MKNYLSLLLAAAALYYFSTKKKGEEKQNEKDAWDKYIEKNKGKDINTIYDSFKKITQQAGSSLLKRQKSKSFAPANKAASLAAKFFNIFDPKLK